MMRPSRTRPGATWICSGFGPKAANAARFCLNSSVAAAVLTKFQIQGFPWRRSLNVGFRRKISCSIWLGAISERDCVLASPRPQWATAASQPDGSPPVLRITFLLSRGEFLYFLRLDCSVGLA